MRFLQVGLRDGTFVGVLGVGFLGYFLSLRGLLWLFC